MQLQAVIEWLQKHDDWLVIVDNVDSESLQQRILKDSEQFHRGCWLFTSRLNQWSPQVVHIDLDTFSPEEALEFLASRLEFEINAQEAGDLSEQLGYLPLALEQAAAYMQMRGQDLATYRRLLTEQPETLLQAAPKNYPRAVWETWNLAYHGLGDDTQALMQLLCCFAPEPLPRELIMDQVETIADSLWNDVDKTYQHVDQLLESLIGYSMVRVDGKLLSVHRLLHQVTRLQSNSDRFTTIQELAQFCLASTVEKLDPQDVRSWPQLEPLIPHIRYCTDELETEQTAVLVNQMGGLFLYKGQYGYAEPLLRRALAIDESSFGIEHPNVAILLNNLAQLLKNTNRLEEAEPLMRRALEIDESSFGVEHPNVAIRLNNLAQLLKDTNRLEEAEPLMRRALEIDESSFGVEHPNVARDLNNLAQLLQDTNRLEEAEPVDAPRVRDR